LLITTWCAKKTADGIIFVHKIETGTSKGSFGIDVARLAALPPQVVVRARALLHAHEAASHSGVMPQSEIVTREDVLALKRELEKKEEVLSGLRDLNLDELSPRAALDVLWHLKKKV